MAVSHAHTARPAAGFPAPALGSAVPPQPSNEAGPGPGTSLEAVFEAEETSLLRYAFGLVGRRAVAEELVQDAFLRLHEHWDDVRQPRAWLFRCVRNRAYNHLRDNKREMLIDCPEAEGVGGGSAGNSGGSGRVDPRQKDMGREAPDDVLGKMEAVGLVHMLLAELGEGDQLFVRLKYFEGFSYKEISERVGTSVGNVGYRLHHILRNLAASLRRAGVEGAQG